MYQLNSGLLSSILMVRVTLKHESEKFFLSFIGDVKTVNMTCEAVSGVLNPLLCQIRLVLELWSLNVTPENWANENVRFWG